MLKILVQFLDAILITVTEVALIIFLTRSKRIVLYLGADYCPWCRKFENKTLQSALIKPRLDEKYDIKIILNYLD